MMIPNNYSDDLAYDRISETYDTLQIQLTKFRIAKIATRYQPSLFGSNYVFPIIWKELRYRYMITLKC
jgi:hypothetical protein